VNVPFGVAYKDLAPARVSCEKILERGARCVTEGINDREFGRETAKELDAPLPSAVTDVVGRTTADLASKSKCMGSVSDGHIVSNLVGPVRSCEQRPTTQITNCVKSPMSILGRPKLIGFVTPVLRP